jgi:hypothetical protein
LPSDEDIPLEMDLLLILCLRCLLIQFKLVTQLVVIMLLLIMDGSLGK